MAEFGILATAGVSGDLPPTVALALGLARRGHGVAFLADRTVTALLERLGWRATVSEPEHDVGPQILRATREAQGVEAEAQGEVVDRRLRDWESDLAPVVAEWTATKRLDAVVGPLFATGICHLALPHTSWCVVNSTYVLDPLTLAADCTPRAYPLLARFAALLVEAPLALHATDALLDGDRALPPRHHYVGPMFWEPPGTVPPWLDEPGDPWVLISLSTLAQDDVPIARFALAALAERRFRVLVTLGSHDAAELGPLPPNARVESFVPHSAVFPRCALLVGHAGHGTTMKAISYGVPMVLVPWGRDQPGVAARAATVGVAEVVPRRGLDEVAMSRAIATVLDGGRFRDAVRTASSRLRQQDAVATACTLVESLL